MKQAVVLIHGIGEQRPLETLRGFVDALNVGKDIRNKPDTINLSFELRRLQVGKSRNRPVTDFYEFYWAHHMRDTKLRMIFQWFSAILLKSPLKISKKLIPFYILGWLFVISTLFFLYHSIFINFEKYKVIFIVIVLALDYLFFRFIIGYIGDAARYLNPHPDNIDQRNKIKTECVQLLHKLHASKQYSRIIMVGHSLGSVIAYDAIRLYWSLYLTPESLLCSNQTVIESFKFRKDAIFKDSLSLNGKVQKYQELQNELWFELRECKFSWLISDFITLGSPLTHAEMLLANNEDEFQRKKCEGEYPVCPPYDSEFEDIFIPKNIEKNDGTKMNVKFPRFHAPFACTRWTNIYFQHKYFFFGDFIGGPLNKVFGEGIRDVAVFLSPLLKRSWLTHILYWCVDEADEGKNHPLKRLKNYLFLDCFRGNRKRQEDWPPP
ncbi:MAG: hypothetical protein CXR30_01205 [Geobacter sp.]|nr:MAG: hypothetical protein CXR30_01205 [Geobacter sp.]